MLMTALPPTKGHLHLIQFAAALADEACIIVVSQPEEPFAFERVAALRAACPDVRFEHIHETLPQGPDEDPDYWMLWRNFLQSFGLQAGDAIVASEDYGFTLAAVTGAVFVPYDFDRGISPIKATPIRLDMDSLRGEARKKSTSSSPRSMIEGLKIESDSHPIPTGSSS